MGDVTFQVAGHIADGPDRAAHARLWNKLVYRVTDVVFGRADRFRANLAEEFLPLGLTAAGLDYVCACAGDGATSDDRVGCPLHDDLKPGMTCWVAVNFGECMIVSSPHAAIGDGWQAGTVERIVDGGMSVCVDLSSTSFVNTSRDSVHLERPAGS